MTRTEWAMNMVRDEHWQALIDELKAAEVKRFADSAPVDVDSREDAYRKIRALDELQAHIEALAMSPEIKAKRWKIL